MKVSFNLSEVAGFLVDALRPIFRPYLGKPLRDRALLLVVIETIAGLLLDVTQDEVAAIRREMSKVTLTPEAQQELHNLAEVTARLRKQGMWP